MAVYTTAIAWGIFMGFFDRLYLLCSDYRNYPSYPHGYIIHLSLGAIAAALAAVAIPALLAKEYTAITFLVLCAQQFRDIRNMERETLLKLEENQLVPRGADYIEGIAKVFEARNYLVMLVALVTSGGIIFLDIKAGAFLGILAIGASKILMSGKSIGEIAEVREGRLYFDGPLLMVEDIVIMNVGEEKARQKILAEGIGIILEGKDNNARAALNNLGQRQAILHDIAALIGSKAEIGEPSFTPMARKNVDTGAIGIYFLPNEHNISCLLEAVKRTPLLESAISRPLNNPIGRKAAKEGKQ